MSDGGYCQNLTTRSPARHLVVGCSSAACPRLPGMNFFDRNKMRILAGALAVGAVALAGCASSNASSSGSGKVTLVVYSAQGYDHAMTAPFQKATGTPVKRDDNSTGPLLTQIEASKNNPNWGLLWVDGATAFAGLDQQGLLQKGFEPNVQWNSLGTASLPSDKSYTPTGVTL